MTDISLPITITDTATHILTMGFILHQNSGYPAITLSVSDGSHSVSSGPVGFTNCIPLTGQLSFAAAQTPDTVTIDVHFASATTFNGVVGFLFDNLNSQAVTQCAAPSFNPAAGAYGPAQNVTISTTTGGATMRYTTDGTHAERDARHRLQHSGEHQQHLHAAGHRL